MSEVKKQVKKTEKGQLSQALRANLVRRKKQPVSVSVKNPEEKQK